jgi:MFS family permease
MATGGFVYRLTISSVPFLLPLMFQTGFGWSPLHAGIMVAAVFIGNIGIKPATTPLIRRFGFRAMLVLGSLASAVTFALCALLTPDTPQALIFALLVCSGAFRSIGFSAYASVQYADIVPAQLTSANSVSATLVQLATGSGIAVGALLIRIFDGVAVFDADAAGPFRGAFLTMAVLMLFSTADSLSLHRHAGAEVSRPAGAETSSPVGADTSSPAGAEVSGPGGQEATSPEISSPAVSPLGQAPAEGQPPPRPGAGHVRPR